jgi:hypothetical protein
MNQPDLVAATILLPFFMIGIRLRFLALAVIALVGLWAAVARWR